MARRALALQAKPTATETVHAATVIKVCDRTLVDVREELLARLGTYSELKEQLDTIKMVMEMELSSIEDLRASTGEKSLKLEQFTVTRVGGNTAPKLDPTKLLELGVSGLILNKATIPGKPKKEHTKVTIGEEKPAEEEAA